MTMNYYLMGAIIALSIMCGINYRMIMNCCDKNDTEPHDPYNDIKDF